MRILFVGRNCKVGGGSTFRYRASMGLIARGHTVSLVAQDGPMSPRFEALGVHHFKVPPTPFNRLKLVSLLKSDAFDVVHAVTPTAGDDVQFALRWVKQNRPAFVLSIHGVLPDSVKDANANPCLTGADEVICFDDFALARLKNLPGLEGRAIHLVPRPIEARDIERSVPDPPLVVMVSRLSKSKGKAALAAIEAVERLQSEFPGLSLRVVGDGSMQPEIARRCEEVNARVGQKLAEAPGFAVDPFPHMASASCVVGTAYVALEALFHEIPVVASGYEAFGLVTEANLEEAVACNFGDGYPGVQPDASTSLFEDGFRQVLAKTQTPEGRAEYERIAARLQARHGVQAVAERLEKVYEGVVR